MKADISSPKAVFIPVAINITFETQEELNKFRALINHPACFDFFKNKEPFRSESIDIVNILDEAGARSGLYREFLNVCMENNLIDRR